jgi:site-specific recombinase
MGYKIADCIAGYIAGYVDNIANFESTEMRLKKKTLLFEC